MVNTGPPTGPGALLERNGDSLLSGEKLTNAGTVRFLTDPLSAPRVETSSLEDTRSSKTCLQRSPGVLAEPDLRGLLMKAISEHGIEA